MEELISIGLGSSIVRKRIVCILSPNSAPMKRLKEEAKKENRLVDATYGRKTRSIIILDTNQIVLSSLNSETITQRYSSPAKPLKIQK